MTSALCYGLITFANKHAATSSVTAFWPVQVVIAVALSYFVFKDSISDVQIGGALMIAAGLVAVVLAARHIEKQAQQQVDMTLCSPLLPSIPRKKRQI